MISLGIKNDKFSTLLYSHDKSLEEFLTENGEVGLIVIPHGLKK